MRICIGLTEIANIASMYARGMQQLGHEVVTVMTSRNPFYPKSQYSLVIDERIGMPHLILSPAAKLLRSIRRRIFQQRLFNDLLPQFDIFIYLFGTSFLPNHKDFALIKKANKRLITVFFGSDIRHWYPFQQEIKRLNLESQYTAMIENIRSSEIDGLDVKQRRVHAAENYADLIVSQPGYGQLQTRPYMRMNIPLDLSEYKFLIPTRRRPLVVHAPSCRGFKGTDQILSVVENLRNTGIDFDFLLVENMPNHKLLDLLTESDIVIDQLYGGTIATLALEAMATGNLVLTNYLRDHAGIPADCPAVNVTVCNLEGNLRRAILDMDWRYQIAQLGRTYVSKNHDYLNVAKQLLEWLDTSCYLDYDFIPDCSVKFQIPPGVAKEDRSRRQRLWAYRWFSLLKHKH